MSKEIVGNLEDKIIDAIARVLLLIAKAIVSDDKNDNANNNEIKYPRGNDKD